MGVMCQAEFARRLDAIVATQPRDRWREAMMALCLVALFDIGYGPMIEAIAGHLKVDLADLRADPSPPAPPAQAQPVAEL